MKALLKPRLLAALYTIGAAFLVAIIHAQFGPTFAMFTLTFTAIAAIFIAVSWVLPVLYESRTVHRNMLTRIQEVSRLLRAVPTGVEQSQRELARYLRETSTSIANGQDRLASEVAAALTDKSAYQRELAGVLTKQHVQLEALMVMLRRRATQEQAPVDMNGERP